MKTKDVNSKPMDADKKKRAPKIKYKDEVGISIGELSFALAPDYDVSDAIEPGYKYKPYSGLDKTEKPIRVKKYSSFLDDKMKESK